MGRKKKTAATLNFEVVIDVNGEVNLYKHGLGPGARGIGKIDNRTLTAVAEVLVKFENKERIKMLDLSQNKITQLPEKLQRLHKLEVLVLDCNSLESLPHWMGELSSLKELWLQDNKLSSPLPRSMEDCHQLIRLVVDKPLEKDAKQILQMAKNHRDAEFERVHGYPPDQAELKMAERRVMETEMRISAARAVQGRAESSAAAESLALLELELLSVQQDLIMKETVATSGGVGSRASRACVLQ
jgi:hypothetical protein